MRLERDATEVLGVAFAPDFRAFGTRRRFNKRFANFELFVLAYS
jgi:hypothetical protein